MSTKPEFIKLKNLTLLTELEFFGVIYLMNKKILGIIAVSVAALGSAIVAAPAHAQSAALPVQITVRPAIFLRTYNELKFVVSQQDLQGGGSVEKVGTYDEAAGSSSLITTPPSNTASGPVRKTVSELYQVWGGRSSTAVSVTATKPILTASSSGTVAGGNQDTVTMSVTSQPPTSFVASGGKAYVPGPVELSFAFSNPMTAAGTPFTGGELTISVTNP